MLSTSIPRRVPPWKTLQSSRIRSSTPPNLDLSCMAVILYVVSAKVVHLGQEAHVLLLSPFFYLFMFFFLVRKKATPWMLYMSGQPKRQLLTTGWSLFVSGKRLLAGDVLCVGYLSGGFLIFYNLYEHGKVNIIISYELIRDENQQLLLGESKSQLSSSVLSSDSMHIGILSAAASKEFFPFSTVQSSSEWYDIRDAC